MIPVRLVECSAAAGTTMTIPADAIGTQGTTVDAAGNQETMIPAWREALVPSLLLEIPVGVKRKSVRL